MTAKQRRFVEEYLTSYNATQAAIAAGYSERTARHIGSENLAKPDIRAAIESRLDELSMTAGEATKRLTDWGRGSVEPFLAPDSAGRLRVDLDTPEARVHLGLIRKVKQTERFIARVGEDGDTLIERRLEVELYSALEATTTLARIRGTLRDRSRVETVDAGLMDGWTQPGDVPFLERIAAGEDPLRVATDRARFYAAKATPDPEDR